MKKRLAGFGVIMIGAVVIALLLLFYAVKIEPYRLKVVEYQLTEEGFIREKPDQKDRMITMVQITDIQISESYTKKELEKIVDKVNEAEADLLFFTGDLYENFAEYGPVDEVVELLSKMQADIGKIAIWGNRDYGGGCVRQYASIMEKSGFILLDNETLRLETEQGKTILVAGLDDELLGAADFSQIRGELEQDQSNYRILLMHEPDPSAQYAMEGFDLILAGHSHGGQVRIPFMKGITTSMAENYIRGFYSLSSDTLLYVNSGIGTSHYPVRFGVVPEITVFQLDSDLVIQ